ncbi:MAG: hypothetical protein A4S08_00920 [Proteobacteria bacterium SG_bin4]|nr:MAG: hypothetical protein A4S08_00920 [Proteobacteria bacterium SG_bin4]
MRYLLVFQVLRLPKTIWAVSQAHRIAALAIQHLDLTELATEALEIQPTALTGVHQEGLVTLPITRMGHPQDKSGIPFITLTEAPFAGMETQRMGLKWPNRPGHSS